MITLYFTFLTKYYVYAKITPTKKGELYMHDLPEIREISLRYLEIITRLSVLFRKLGIHKSPVFIYEAFYFMYQNGFLSSTGTYCSDIPKEIVHLEEMELGIELDLCGSILLTGTGICRHLTNFLSFLFQYLGYNSSQLFTYSPRLNIKVDNQENLPPHILQQYIDEAIKDFDLFSKEETHFINPFGNNTVSVDYFPPVSSHLTNHTMNIVLGKDGFAHILDSFVHQIGEKIDSSHLKMSQSNGLWLPQFVTQNVNVKSFYSTNYYKGLGILEYGTKAEQDIKDSIEYAQACKEFWKAFKDFFIENQTRYQGVSNCFDKLTKRYTL